MNYQSLMLSLVLGLLLLSGCSNEEQLKAWNMVDNGALLVDVRTPGEYSSGHLPGSKLIPISQVSVRIAEFGSDKSRPIVVYCRSGSRSGKAAKILEANGYTNVQNGGGYSAMMSARKEMI